MPDSYLLRRDKPESQRLDEQHALWLRQGRYLVHPLLKEKLPANARIADVATGTGIWARDAAKMFPQAQVHAFDISPNQFPTEEEQKRMNVTYHVHDVFNPFDSEMQGKFDFVHVRALVAAMRPSDWETVIQHIGALLKPGGVLHWLEVNLSNLVVLRGGEASIEPTGARLTALVEHFNTKMAQRDLGGAARLPAAIARNGFDVLRVDTVSNDRVPDDRAFSTANFVIAMLGAARDAIGSESDVEATTKAIESEIAAGAYIRANVYVALAQRT